MKKKVNYLIIFSVLLIVCSCAPSRYVRPLEKNQNAISASLGGPLINFSGAVIPIPFTTFNYARGINDKVTAFGSLHPTALAFGTIQTDLGILYGIRKQDSLNPFIPGLSSALVANMAIDKWENNFKCWPELDLNAYWNYGKHKSLCYIGISNWFELAQFKAHNELQPKHWIWNPHIGNTFACMKWSYTVELKYEAPDVSNQDLVADYVKVFGKKGAMGVFLGITRKI